MESGNEFVKKVKTFSLKNKLLKKGDRVLICLSGGADSVCLLRTMCALKDELELEIYASHVNHMLRGEAADADEAFCKNLCSKLGIKIYTLRADVLAQAKERRESFEAVARNIRYKYFFSLKSELMLDVIITAHNQNDNTETSIMYYLRGSGIDGLKGISPRREDGVVRPLLCVSRAEIEDYLSKLGQSFVTDKTNFDDVYTRNKIRLNLIPEIEKNYNANLVEVISDNALLLGLDADYLNKEARKISDSIICDESGGLYISVKNYNKIDKALALRVIRCALAKVRGSDKDISYDMVMRCDALFGEVETSKKVSIADGLFARRDYDRVCFEKASRDCSGYCYEAVIGGKTYIKEADMSFCLSIVDKMETKKKNCEYFDYNLLDGKIYIRSRKNGDFFAPFNMKGTKKLKDFFIDEKISASKRAILPLIVCNEQILWVCNLRRSDLYKINEETKQILKVEFWEGK